MWPKGGTTSLAKEIFTTENSSATLHTSKWTFHNKVYKGELMKQLLKLLVSPNMTAKAAWFNRIKMTNLIEDMFTIIR